MRKNITLLVFLAIGTVVVLASYRSKGNNNKSVTAMLTAHSWNFEKAESLNANSSAVVNHLYQNAKYNFTSEKTYQGEFFEIPIQGKWSIEGEKLILNKGTFEEEQMEIAFVDNELLKVRLMERGASVTAIFR
jgi:hypothetical protein